MQSVKMKGLRILLDRTGMMMTHGGEITEFWAWLAQLSLVVWNLD